MRVLLQRVHRANLYVDDREISRIGAGLLVSVGINRYDTPDDVEYMARKIANMRIFSEDGKLKKSVLDLGYDILLVSNFSLQAEITSGTRPNFNHAMDKIPANDLYLSLKDTLLDLGVKNVALGKFGEHMHIDMILDGPFSVVVDTKND